MRRILRPSEIGTKPASFAASTSPGSNPPSGPMKTATLSPGLIWSRTPLVFPGSCSSYGISRTPHSFFASSSASLKLMTGSTCGNAPCTCSGCAGGVSGGCLVPRIISTGRTFQRRITQTLCVNDLPDHAESPLTLVGVTVSGPATWEQISECRQTLLRVTVPVAVQIRDCAGRCRTGHSTVTLTIPLCMNCPAQDFWRGQLYVAPCIRLAAPVTEDEDGCFDAALEVQAEVFLLRMQVIDC